MSFSGGSSWAATAALVVFALLGGVHGGGGDQSAAVRNARFMSLFNVVRFEDGPCPGVEPTEQGICLSASRCSSAGGKDIGHCASGM